MPLNSLGIQIERHWREHRPKMVAELQGMGRLEAALEAAEYLTLTAEADAVNAGLSPDQAREQFRQLWAFLSSEDDVPDLGTEPALWSTADPNPWTHGGWCSGEQPRAWRAELKAERDDAIARIKQRLARGRNGGIPHALVGREHQAEDSPPLADRESAQTHRGVPAQRTWRLLPRGAGLEAERREERRRIRAMYWQARPFWQICWFASWIPVAVAVVYGMESTYEPLVWSWWPLRLNAPLIGRRTVFLSALLATCLLYRVAGVGDRMTEHF